MVGLCIMVRLMSGCELCRCRLYRWLLLSVHSWTVQLGLKQLISGGLLPTGDLSLLALWTWINPLRWYLETWLQQCAFTLDYSWGLHGWYSPVTICFWLAMLQMKLYNCTNSHDGQGLMGTCHKRKRKTKVNHNDLTIYPWWLISVESYWSVFLPLNWLLQPLTMWCGKVAHLQLFGVELESPPPQKKTPKKENKTKNDEIFLVISFVW